MRKEMIGQIITAVMLMLMAFGQTSNQAVDNGQIRVVVESVKNGYERVRFFVRQQSRWIEVARWQPIIRIVYDGREGEVDWRPALRFVSVSKNSLRLS
ncbi:MAG: hypothetical protein QW795_07910, partial [Candidatus Bathyarchaeia archaeon]